jgi:hypothetical protein
MLVPIPGAVAEVAVITTATTKVAMEPVELLLLDLRLPNYAIKFSS